ncbi:hypothetical protein GCM10023191_012770 [Actinoallomurus oryzae]|uniref:Helix-turn-helix domain-containing protein n=1 Tax=Actinoallomurus oryzae TaxID=502180 RepID=A0ABP8PH50_9ACTN
MMTLRKSDQAWYSNFPTLSDSLPKIVPAGEELPRRLRVLMSVALGGARTNAHTRGDVEAHASRERGWTISAIARHLDRGRKTIRAYPGGQRDPAEHP